MSNIYNTIMLLFGADIVLTLYSAQVTGFSVIIFRTFSSYKFTYVEPTFIRN